MNNTEKPSAKIRWVKGWTLYEKTWTIFARTIFARLWREKTIFLAACLKSLVIERKHLFWLLSLQENLSLPLFQLTP